MNWHLQHYTKVLTNLAFRRQGFRLLNSGMLYLLRGSRRGAESIFRDLDLLDDPVGEGSLQITPNPMIVERDNPVWRDKAQDPSSENPAHLGRERGHLISAILIRGEEALKKIYERGEYRGYKFIVFVAPISRAYLLYGDILRDIRSLKESLVIPSSYDDVAIYVNMRREGYKICSRQIKFNDITVICLERGERPWGRISMEAGRGYKIIFSEDLDPVDVEDLPWSVGTQNLGIIYISYGVVQPIGIRVGPWVSVRLNPFKNTISKIEINEDHIDLEIEILEDTYTYTSIEHRI